jgi:hypothetical protein
MRRGQKWVKMIPQCFMLTSATRFLTWHPFVSEVLMRGLLTLLVGGVLCLSLFADESGKKLPVPSKTAQAKSLALVLDIFKDDIQAATDAEAKVKLAANLLQQGRDSRDDAANRYVLFREARLSLPC